VSAQEEVATVIRAIFRAFADGQPERIADVQHPDCTVWDVFTPRLLRGRAELERFHAADQVQKSRRGPLRLEVGEPLVDVWDDTAVARYVVDFSYEPPEALDGQVRVTDVLRRSEGRWLVVHHHEGMVPG
jgi:uncharacterized protein (TIGR02246 family)